MASRCLGVGSQDGHRRNASGFSHLVERNVFPSGPPHLAAYDPGDDRERPGDESAVPPVSVEAADGEKQRVLYRILNQRCIGRELAKRARATSHQHPAQLRQRFGSLVMVGVTVGGKPSERISWDGTDGPEGERSRRLNGIVTPASHLPRDHSRVVVMVLTFLP